MLRDNDWLRDPRITTSSNPRVVGGYALPCPTASENDFARFYNDDLAALSVGRLESEELRLRLVLAEPDEKLDRLLWALDFPLVTVGDWARRRLRLIKGLLRASAQGQRRDAP
jgi:hypothetical protein